MKTETWARSKRPDEIARYGVTWKAELGEDTIETSEWDVESDTSESLVAESLDFEGPIAYVELSAGAASETAAVINTITTSGGETLQMRCLLRIDPVV